MGGNGAREHYMNGTLGQYNGSRFEQVGEIDGCKVIEVSTQSNTKVPMESFTSSMYYVTTPGKARVIRHITFYDKNGDIKVSIDMEYDQVGNLMPFCSITRQGKKHTQGVHMHHWSMKDNGDKGRQSHASENISQVNRYYMRFVNKAIIYNKQHKK